MVRVSTLAIPVPLLAGLAARLHPYLACPLVRRLSLLVHLRVSTLVILARVPAHDPGCLRLAGHRPVPPLIWVSALDEAGGCEVVCFPDVSLELGLFCRGLTVSESVRCLCAAVALLVLRYHSLACTRWGLRLG